MPSLQLPTDSCGIREGADKPEEWVGVEGAEPRNQTKRGLTESPGE